MWQRATHVTLLLLLIICCSPSVRLPLYLVDSELELGTDAFGATFALADILPLNPTTATSQPSPTSAASASIGTSQESARVMGLGVGLFALLIVGIIFVIITLFAAQSGYGYAAGLILAVVYAIIVGILVSVPKLGPGQVVETPPVTDDYYHGRVAFTVLAGLFALLSLVMALAFHCFTPVYANGNPRD